jgi:hypothetical protein
MSTDPNQPEQLFVPAAIIRFLVAITSPSSTDKVLNINLDPVLLSPEINNKINQSPDFIKSEPAL